MVFTQKSSKRITNMTEGSPYRLLLFFSLPLMAGNVFQQLYTVTDTAIVGRALGVSALAALGAVEWFNWMSLGLVQGITQGFSILISQRFGAEDSEGLKRSVGNSYTLAAICAITMLVFMQLIVGPAFYLMRIPKEVLPIAETYTRIMFCGIPIIMAYNMLSSILRALGDSRTPLNAMILASFMNIGLDLLFVLVFRWGVAGAAIATLMAQMFSAVFCVQKMRPIELLHIKRDDLKLRGTLVRNLMALSAPMALQNIIIAVGGIVVQSVVNRYGVIFMAGYSATNKLYGVLEIAATSYGFALTTYVGQNMGAGKNKRISQGIRAGLVIGIGTSCLISLMMFLFGRQILGCFISTNGDAGVEALALACRYLRIMSIFLPVLYILYVVRSTIQGMGNTVIPMISGMSEFIMRLSASFIMPLLLPQTGILFAEVIAWFGADLVLIPGYFYMHYMQKKQMHISY